MCRSPLVVLTCVQVDVSMYACVFHACLWLVGTSGNPPSPALLGHGDLPHDLRRLLGTRVASWAPLPQTLAKPYALQLLLGLLWLHGLRCPPQASAAPQAPRAPRPRDPHARMPTAAIFAHLISVRVRAAPRPGRLRRPPHCRSRDMESHRSLKAGVAGIAAGVAAAFTLKDCDLGVGRRKPQQLPSSLPLGRR